MSGVAASILARAAAHPTRDALVCGGKPVSYGELAGKASAVALELRAKGVGPGDRVVLGARSRTPGFVHAWLACRLLGAVPAPLDGAAPAAAFEDAARRLRAKLVLRETGGLDPKPAAVLAPAPVKGEDAAEILFTGGTTGAPKGVVLAERGLACFARGREAFVGAAEGTRLVLPLPLSHGFGLSRLRATLSGGGTVILVDGFGAPGDLFAALDLGADGLCAVPSAFAALEAVAPGELGGWADRLRFVESATAALGEAARERLLELLPKTKLFNAWGMTETSSSIAYVELRGEPSKRATVGRAIPGVEIRQDGARLLVRGDSVMLGYWEDPQATAAVLSGGLFEAGDTGSLDADGYVTLGGRREELINVGGLKVAPAEVENALKAHPAVADCACAPVADPVAGERVKAFLVPEGEARPGARELGAFLQGKLEGWKIPAAYAWVDALPRTELGKLKRSALK